MSELLKGGEKEEFCLYTKKSKKYREKEEEILPEVLVDLKASQNENRWKAPDVTGGSSRSKPPARVHRVRKQIVTRSFVSFFEILRML